MLIYVNLISAQFSNTISSEVPCLNDIKFYVRHHGEGLYQSDGNYANAAILSAEVKASGPLVFIPYHSKLFRKRLHLYQAKKNLTYFYIFIP